MRNVLYFVIFIVALLTPFVAWAVLANIARDEGPVVLTSQGAVRGVLSSDGQYAMFMGMPYAMVDLDNPFGESLPGPIFQGVFEADDDSAICPQREEFNNTLVGSLDCLHINVYVPTSASTDNSLPVMVSIYGGGWQIGFAGRYVYGPQYIVRHDVILVTMNYRLGPYGFMCLDMPSVPGNTGLKDQRAGLRWVKENIAAFGGDIGSITAFGNSAGAMSIDHHILSPGSNGLFNRAILQSGTTLAGGSSLQSNPSVPLELAAYFGSYFETVEEALNMLKDIPAYDLLTAGEELGINYSPCVERTFEDVESFLLDNPSILLASGQFESVPMLVGYNSDEYMSSHMTIDNESYFDQMQDKFFQSINASFVFSSENEAEAAAKLVQQFYTGTKALDRELMYEISDFQSDIGFNYPIERFLTYHLEKSEQSIYQYLFAYSGELNFAQQRLNITVDGAVHADEIGYLYKLSYVPDVNNQEDQRIVDQMTAMWTNFAKYGDPTPETSELLPVRWPPVTRDLREYLHIDKELVVDRKPFHSRIAFWDLFYLLYGNTESNQYSGF